MSAADDLAEVLAPEIDPDGFTVDTLEAAAWTIARIGLHRKNLAKAEALATDWRDRIDAYIAGERHRCASATAHLEDLLRRYHERRITDDNPGAATWDAVHRSKTIRTPAGDLVARKLPDTVAVDNAVFVPWAREHATDMLNPPKDPTPSIAAIKRAVGEVMADGQVVDGVTGVFLPGVTWVEGDVRFTVEVGE